MRDTIKDKRKQQILLSDEIPSGFTNSQGANSQNIALRVKEILSSIVSPCPSEKKYITVLSTNGSITNILKKDWHLNDTWNKLMLPRFKRLNEWAKDDLFTREINGHEVPCVPEPYCYNFELKRIDHRHHALDALIIALTNTSYINYVSSSNSGSERYDLKAKWMIKDSYVFLPPCQYYNNGKVVTYSYRYQKDGKEANGTLNDVTFAALQDIIVTFKQKKACHVLRQRINWYKHPDENGIIIQDKEKGLSETTKYCVRIPLHDATLRGLRHSRIVPIKDAIMNNKYIISKKARHAVEKLRNNGESKNKILDSLCCKYPYVEVKEDVVVSRWKNSIYRLNPKSSDMIKIESIADIRIQHIIYDYIKSYLVNVEDVNDQEKIKEAKKLALCEEGIKKLNSIIEEKYNHKPIYYFQIAEAKGTATALSKNENSVKSKQFAKTADNPYKVLSIREEGEERRFTICDINTFDDKSKENLPLFNLIAGDIVYVPNEEEINSDVSVFDIDKDRLYKFISSNTAKPNKPNAYFIPHRIASFVFSDKESKIQLKKKVPGAPKSILNGELSITRASTRTETEIPYISNNRSRTIRDICWKLEVDRLGNIIRIIR